MHHLKIMKYTYSPDQEILKKKKKASCSKIISAMKMIKWKTFYNTDVLSHIQEEM